MTEPPAVAMNKLAKAHAAADAADIARLRSLSQRERSRLIELACESAAAIYGSRLAEGLGEVQPDPWPASTWEFLRKHAVRVRS